MGNRAVITTGKNDTDIGVYLHWNGGRASVEGFLKYCELKGYRPPETDNYGWARLCQVVGNYFGGGLSIGVDIRSRLDCDNWDNGVYIIRKWKIVGREFFQGAEQMDYPLLDFVKDIDAHMPKNEQIGDEKIESLLKGGDSE